MSRVSHRKPLDDDDLSEAEAYRALAAMQWARKEERLLSLLTQGEPGTVTPVNDLIEKLYRPRWGSGPRRGGDLSDRERKNRARLVERLRGLRRRINVRLGAVNNPLRVLGEGGGLCLDIPGEPDEDEDDDESYRRYAKMHPFPPHGLLKFSASDKGDPKRKLRQAYRKRGRKTGKGSHAVLGVQACAIIVASLLGDPVDSATLRQWVMKEHFSVATFRRACRQLGVQRYKERRPHGRWFSRLPG